MANTTNHSKTRFIPSEELQDRQVRLWRFGDVGLGTPGGSVLPPLDSGAGLQPLMQEAPAEHTLEEAACLPEADDGAAPEEAEPAAPALDEEALQQLLEQARQEGFAQGLEQGLQQAGQEWQQRMQDYQNNQGREQGQRLSEIVHQAQNGIQGLQQQVLDFCVALVQCGGANAILGVKGAIRQFDADRLLFCLQSCNLTG